MPVAAPLPRRLLGRVEPGAGWRLPIRMVIRSFSGVELLHLDEVADLEDHSPDLGRVVVLHRLVHAADAERACSRRLVGAMAARALDLAHPQPTRHAALPAAPAAPPWC